MSVSAKVKPSGDEVVIAVKGRFDFSTHQDFRRSYETIPAQGVQFTVDLQEATYLDSSALGMLLLLREYAKPEEQPVKIVNCNADIKKILKISNFEQLFQIQ
jgi:anti-anti-sigma factor